LLEVDLAQLRERAWVKLLQLAPASLRSYTLLLRVAGKIALPRGLREPVFGWIATRVGIDLSEAELPLADYSRFREIFVRRLQPGLRPVDGNDGAVVSPVDGCVTTFGRAERDRLIQAKGIDYTLGELLDDSELARELEGGTFVTLYLRPHDYHRIHAPVAGEVASVRRIPGTLFPVKPYMVRSVRGLLCRNERVVAVLETELGRVGVVCVAAAGVGTVTVSVEPWRGALLSRGDELAAFNLGSTVILIFGPGRVELEPLRAGQEIRVGQALARRVRRATAGLA
jgi:phosphatidylserine decarboxylase